MSYPNLVFQALSHTWKTPVPYLYGGYQESTGWDCSGFVGNILTTIFGLVLPGFFSGTNGLTHNIVWHPVLGYHPSPAEDYKVWRSAETISDDNTATLAEAGDLLVWDTHIGIALGPDVMVSALSSQYATAVTPVAGFGPGNETLMVRRIKPGLVS